MALKTFKPVTPGLRFRAVSSFEETTEGKPEKGLLAPKHSSGGRNNKGRITMRRRGGGHKRSYRIVDFRRDKLDVPAKVASIQYDPNRSANIALLHYADGEKRYILAPVGLSVNDQVVSGEKPEIDARLREAAEHWSLERMAVIDRCVLRIATAELMAFPEVDAPVAIDEAVSVASEYGTDASGGFVNGILDRIARALRPNEFGGSRL